MKRNASNYSDNSILLFPVNKMRHSLNATIDRIFLSPADGRKYYTLESDEAQHFPLYGQRRR